LALAGSGKILASQNTDSTVDFWDLDKRKRFRRLGNPIPSDESVCMCLSSRGDVLARGRHLIELWDVAKGKRLRQFGENVTRPHYMRYRSLAFSPDGKNLVSGSPAGIDLWETATGKRVRRFAKISYATVALSPDGKMLAVGGQDLADTDDQAGVKKGHRVSLWDVASGQKLRVLSGHEHTIIRVVYSQDGRYLASASSDYTAKVWKVRTGKELCQFKGDRGEFACMAFSNNGQLLASARNNTIKIWDVATGKERNPLRAHQDEVRAAAYSPDGKILASGAYDGTVRLWETATGKCLRTFHDHRGGVWTIAFSPDGRTIFSGGKGGGISCRDVTTGIAIGRLGTARKDVAHLALSSDGKLLVASGKGGSVEVWERDKRKIIRSFVAKHKKYRFKWIPLSPDGTILAACPRNLGVVLWDIPNGQERGQLDANGATVSQLVFSPDSKTLAGIARSDDKVCVWDVATRNEIAQFERGGYGGNDQIAFSPDGRALVIGIGGNRLQFLEVASSQVIFRAPVPDHVTTIAFSPDGKTLVTGGGNDFALLVWDVRELAGAGTVPPGRLIQKELALFWEDLVGENALRAYRARWGLVGSPEQTLHLFQKDLQPAAPPTSAQLQGLLTRLGDSRYRTRQKATQELEKIGELTQPALVRLLLNKPGPEVANRVRRLLQKIERQRRYPSPEQLRQIRAVAVLEQIGTADARRLLRRLANGAPGARLSREAQASWQRLATKTATKH
jgi:WD40 repeat protein